MIRLIVNEFRKTSLTKLIIVFVLLMLVIFGVIYINNDSDEINIFNTIYSLIPFVGIIIILLSSSIITSEYQNGTFKYYLTKPYKRYKVLLSKIITLFIVTTMIILFIFLFYLLFLNIYGKLAFNINNLLKCYVYALPLYFISIFTILLCLIFKKSSISSCLSLFIYMLSPLLSILIFDKGFNFIEYTFLPYLDYSMFINKLEIISMNELYNTNISIINGSIILVSDMIIFYIISNYIFNKKDITM